MIAIVAFQILKSSVQGPARDFIAKPVEVAIAKAANSGPAAVLYLLALGVLYKWTNKWVVIMLVVCGAVAGQALCLE